MGQVIAFRVNGDQYELAIEPWETLLDVLRERLGLTGTKKGCDEGDCGACTILMDGRAVNSCLILAVQAEGKEIVTIEGLSNGSDLHPVQQAFVEQGAIQCGYCTPGMVMSAVHLLQKNPKPSESQIRCAIAGNLCRCTGYVKIVAAIKAAAADLAAADARTES